MTFRNSIISQTNFILCLLFGRNRQIIEWGQTDKHTNTWKSQLVDLIILGANSLGKLSKLKQKKILKLFGSGSAHPHFGKFPNLNRNTKLFLFCFGSSIPPPSPIDTVKTQAKKSALKSLDLGQTPPPPPLLTKSEQKQIFFYRWFSLVRLVRLMMVVRLMKLMRLLRLGY